MKSKKRVIILMLCIILCVSAFPATASAASYPSMAPDDYEYTVMQGEVLEVKYHILHEFNHEQAHIRIRQGSIDGPIVAEADRDFSVSTIKTEYTVTWDTSNAQPGIYWMEYWMSFYSMYDWHDVPSHSYLPMITVEAPPCPNGHSYDAGKVTKEATCKSTGTLLKTCTVCGQTTTETIEKTDHKWDEGTIQTEATATKPGVKVYTCKVCTETTTEPLPAKFTDTDASSYYAPAIDWAYTHNVTSGTSDKTFSPDATCTRGQVLTFLWRAKGCPEPKSDQNPFRDIAPSQYYYKAVLWGVEQGITAGTSDTTFSPDATCSYAHILTFIWRSQDKPDYTGKGNWYSDALNWALDYNLLDETPATENVESACPRCNVVTYLYRILDEEAGKELQHKYSAWTITKNATCTTDGIKTRTCTDCGKTQTRAIPMTGHTWTAATCSHPKTCSVCGATEGSALAHNYVNGVCSVCGAKNPNYVKQNLVYKDSRVIISFQEITSKGVVFEVENLTNATVTIQADAIAINKKSTENITMSDDVAPMSIGTVTARCGNFVGMKAGIISGQLRVIDFNYSFDSYDALFSNVILDSDVVVEEPAVPKTLVYSDSRVNIYYESVDQSGVYFTVQNLTDRLITIQADSVSVNKRSTNDITMSDDVAPHSTGTVKARCAPAVTSGVTTIGGTLRIIDFGGSFTSYNATFINVPVVQ